MWLIVYIESIKYNKKQDVYQDLNGHDEKPQILNCIFNSISNVVPNLHLNCANSNAMVCSNL